MHSKNLYSFCSNVGVQTFILNRIKKSLQLTFWVRNSWRIYEVRFYDKYCLEYRVVPRILFTVNGEKTTSWNTLDHNVRIIPGECCDLRATDSAKLCEELASLNRFFRRTVKESLAQSSPKSLDHWIKKMCCMCLLGPPHPSSTYPFVQGKTQG